MAGGIALRDIAGQITTISFDADGTLWDFETVMRSSLAKTLAELQRLHPPQAGSLTVGAMIATREEVAGELRGKELNLEAVRYAGFRRTLEQIGLPDDDLAGRLTAFYLQRRFDDITLFDDVRPAFAALQGRYALGVVSNGNTYPERVGLRDTFQFIVFAQDHGVAKPDPGLLRVATEQAGCSEQQLLHVGDSLEDDVLGAKEAGVWSVWLNRAGEQNNTGILPDFQVTSLLELAELGGRVGDTPSR